MIKKEQMKSLNRFIEKDSVNGHTTIINHTEIKNV